MMRGLDDVAGRDFIVPLFAMPPCFAHKLASRSSKWCGQREGVGKAVSPHLIKVAKDDTPFIHSFIIPFHTCEGEPRKRTPRMKVSLTVQCYHLRGPLFICHTSATKWEAKWDTNDHIQVWMNSHSQQSTSSPLVGRSRGASSSSAVGCQVSSSIQSLASTNRMSFIPLAPYHPSYIYL